jgi:hypothetical protein
LPSNYTAASVADLIADLNAANAAGGANTLTLAPLTSFGNGLPEGFFEEEGIGDDL